MREVLRFSLQGGEVKRISGGGGGGTDRARKIWEVLLYRRRGVDNAHVFSKFLVSGTGT